MFKNFKINLKSIVLTAAISTALLSTMLLSTRAQAPPPLAAGTAAPAFTTKTLAGQPLTLKSLRGKVVLIDVWATWCGPCRMATPMLQALHKKYVARGLQVVGISVDDTSSLDKVPAYKKAYNVTYTLSASPTANAKLAQAYKAEGIPSIYLIDQKGIVRWSQSGYDSANEEKDLSKMIEDLLGKSTVNDKHAKTNKNTKTAHR